MTFMGLHFLDAGVILIYVLGILWIGKKVSKQMHNLNEFFISGRRLGKVYQFFLNFGNSTNADQAVAVSREIYRQGIGGMWIQYLVLFLTPFYWFTTLLYRRSRLITIGDFFTERFRSEFLGAAFAIFTIFMAFIGGGVGYMIAGKTMMALTPKPLQECTPAEQRSIALFHEYQELKAKLDHGLTATQQLRYDELHERYKKGELRSFISYTDPVKFYFIYALIVALYTMMGGFTAAAITDALQGLLIITFSVILIPLGLAKIGGFSGLHNAVPDYMFHLFGSVSTSEYTWYTVFAMVLANLVSIIAAAPMMACAGSARDEMTARFGMIGGMFFKRFIMIFWALAGLLAVALYAGKLHDPDLIWGYMTRDLLFPGAIGLMLAGILAANMSSLDASSVANSALFIKNIYQPLVKNKSQQHYLLMGRLIIAITLLGSIGVAVFVGNLLALFKYFISMPAIFGASIWLGFTWRRLTRWAVIIQIFVCIVIYAIIPNAFQAWNWAKTYQPFLRETQSRETIITTPAKLEDVEEGRAQYIGQSIQKVHRVEPVGIFFERVARQDPANPRSPKIGIGRFHAEIWVLSLVGIDFSNFSKAGLVTTRFLFDAIFPFILLFFISFFTRSVPVEHLNRFFAKMHTPVQPTPEAEQQALIAAANNPQQFENQKLFPGSNWEILKPTWKDFLGFGGSWVMVGVVILVLWLVVNLK